MRKIYMNMLILILALIALSLIAIFYLILRDVKHSEYHVSESELSKSAEEKYIKEFPDYTVDKLKHEIEAIADILVDNQESNRYTEVLREKAENDEKVQVLKDAVLEDVDIVRYRNKELKAKVRYRDYDYNYNMVLNFSSVARGRIFLNNYWIYKENIVKV